MNPALQQLQDLLQHKGLAQPANKSSISLEEQKDDPNEARRSLYALAVERLGRREYSEQELRQYLSNSKVFQQFGSTEVESALEQVIQELKGKGYLNDQRFCEQWIRSRVRNKPRGRMLLMQELQQKGVNKLLVNQTLDEFFSKDIERTCLQTLLLKKQVTLGHLDEKKQREKLTRFLSSKGFGFSLIRQEIDNILKR